MPAGGYVVIRFLQLNNPGWCSGSCIIVMIIYTSFPPSVSCLSKTRPARSFDRTSYIHSYIISFMEWRWKLVRIPPPAPLYHVTVEFCFTLKIFIRKENSNLSQATTKLGVARPNPTTQCRPLICRRF